MTSNSASYEDTFHPILHKSGLWICAQYTQTESNAIEVRVWESSDCDNEKMKSLHFFGLVLKALHLAQGGDPSRAEGLVWIASPMSIPLPNGVLHSTTAVPTGKNVNRHTLELAWPMLFCDLSASMGLTGQVEDESLPCGNHRITVEYGPAVLLRPHVLPPDVSFRTVELSTTLSSGTSLKPGG